MEGVAQRFFPGPGPGPGRAPRLYGPLLLRSSAGAEQRRGGRDATSSLVTTGSSLGITCVEGTGWQWVPQPSHYSAGHAAGAEEQWGGRDAAPWTQPDQARLGLGPGPPRMQMPLQLYYLNGAGYRTVWLDAAPRVSSPVLAGTPWVWLQMPRAHFYGAPLLLSLIHI